MFGSGIDSGNRIGIAASMPVPVVVCNHPAYLVSLPLDRECEDSQAGLCQHGFVLEVRLHGGDHQAAHALGAELRDVGELWGWGMWGGVGWGGVGENNIRGRVVWGGVCL